MTRAKRRGKRRRRRQRQQRGAREGGREPQAQGKEGGRRPPQSDASGVGDESGGSDVSVTGDLRSGWGGGRPPHVKDRHGAADLGQRHGDQVLGNTMAARCAGSPAAEHRASRSAALSAPTNCVVHSGMGLLCSVWLCSAGHVCLHASSNGQVCVRTFITMSFFWMHVMWPAW